MDPLWMLKQSLNSTEEAALSNHTTNSSYSDFHDPAFSTLELLDSPTRTSLVILYSTTSVIAFVGNLIVIIVETFGRRSAANLRKFLINLAISDILFAVFSVPFTYTVSFCIIQLKPFLTDSKLNILGFYVWTLDILSMVVPLGPILRHFIPFVKSKQMVNNKKWNNQTYLDCRPDMELYGSRYYNIVSVMSTFGFPLLIQSYCYYSVIRCLLSKDTVTISQACRRHNREMKRFFIKKFSDLITKICSDRRDSLACAHVPISRTSHNPYIDYESRNSSLTNAL
ncbi:hypothetical protein TYRP_000219 [Tyrophagus putrescentiae]|nr:hypothetical protein TYRP_000219 [Tyrophagus putrescentiae]